MSLHCLLLCAVMVLICATEEVCAEDRGVGLGVVVGEPTGISLKAWVSARNALDAGLAWSFGRGGRVHIHADYLFHLFGELKIHKDIVPYLGLGGRLAVGSGDEHLGIRIPFGMVWWPREVPLDLFVELAPIVDLTPSTKLRANAGIGVRYFFQ